METSVHAQPTNAIVWVSDSDMKKVRESSTASGNSFMRTLKDFLRENHFKGFMEPGDYIYVRGFNGVYEGLGKIMVNLHLNPRLLKQVKEIENVERTKVENG